MDNEDARLDGSEESSRRACDQCRVRKVRCDKESPCANCRTANRSCSSTGLGQKPKEQKQRVLISAQYERKIDLMEERLGNIEDMLRSISLRLGNGGGGGSGSGSADEPPLRFSTPSGISREPPTAGSRNDSETGSAFEGDSSLTAQSVFASEFLEKAVERTSLRDTNPNIHGALASLRQIVTMQKEQSSGVEFTFPNQCPPLPRSAADLPMPPVSFVVTLLRQLKESEAGIFGVVFPFITMDDFAKLCQRVYFSTEDYSDATFILVNAGLYYIFVEQGFNSKDPTAKSQYHGYRHMCQVNLETALSRLPLLLPGKSESIEALLIGAMYAVGVSKPTLAWHLNATAAQMCQTLGYHRAETNPEKSGGVDVKPMLFWHIYTLDKSLSLRLGRASVIQEWDITLPRQLDYNSTSGPWQGVLNAWIKFADVQSDTYELLYSPRALSKPRNEVAKCAQRLGEQLKKITAEAAKARSAAFLQVKAVNDGQLIGVLLKGDELSFYTTLTLIYRAIPAPEGSPSSFCSDCINAARLAMRAHHECMSLMGTNVYLQVVYIHWAILLTPFAPFFVLFCHVIESSSPDDMSRLRAFVNSLVPACQQSDQVEKLQRLCQVLYNVAIVYVEAKTQQQFDHNMVPIGNEFDTYLNALGLMPLDSQPPGGMVSDASHQMSGIGSHLGEWFSGNRQMMELLERDIPQFDANAEWM